MCPTRKRIVPILKKTVVATAFALLFAFLGIFDFVGYHASAVELSFNANFDSARETGILDGRIEASGESAVKLDLTYNPILQPFQWLTGQGCLTDIYTVAYTTDEPFSRSAPPGELYTNRGAPSSSGVPSASISPPSAAERIEYLILYLTAGAFPQNFLALVPASMLVEASGRRWIYSSLFGGIFGFVVAGLVGLVFGVAVGAILIGLFRFRLKGMLQRWLSERSVEKGYDRPSQDENAFRFG